MVFFNWTLTGFWIIYNSSDYSKNAQIISAKISMSQDVNKQSVVYGLIIYTIIISCITFFGLVGVCYENFVMTFGLACLYLLYIVFDTATNILIGVPFNVFMVLLLVLLILTCINLFYLSWLIHFEPEYSDDGERGGLTPCHLYHEDDGHHHYRRHQHMYHHHHPHTSVSHPFSSRVDFYDNTQPHFESIALS